VVFFAGVPSVYSMVVSTSGGLVGVTILAGVGMCWLGAHCYWRRDEPGVNAFAAVAVVFGLAGIAGGLAAVAGGTTVRADTAPLWADIAVSGWVLGMVPWILFALQYTGRYTRVRARTVAVLAAPVVGIVLLFVLQAGGEGTVLTQLAGTVGILYVVALATVGSYLLVRTSYEYGHLATRQGVSLAVAGFAPLVFINTLGPLADGTAEPVVFGVYALAFVVPAVAFALAVFRYGMFESTPAVGALGERAIPRETDDLVFVVDRDGRVIKINQTATETLAVEPTEPLGSPFASLVGRSVDALRESDTVELETAVGTRQFDPQVSAFTDQHGRQLGSLLSLRDVTTRELRKQRLAVLNRVLRHNLRNQVDVIKSNAEAATSSDNREYTAAIRESADGLASLSAKARAIDQLLSEETTRNRVDLTAVVRDLVETLGDESVTLDVPETAPLVTDRTALESALRSAIENAVEHADARVTVTIEETAGGYEAVVADDGPGIPDSELESLDAGTETPLRHGTGIGLWQLKWSVRTLNGTLSVETTGGTTVRLTVPDQAD
jgi:signal transduction histidine kinase